MKIIAVTLLLVLFLSPIATARFAMAVEYQSLGFDFSGGHWQAFLGDDGSVGEDAHKFSLAMDIAAQSSLWFEHLAAQSGRFRDGSGELVSGISSERTEWRLGMDTVLVSEEDTNISWGIGYYTSDVSAKGELTKLTEESAGLLGRLGAELGLTDRFRIHGRVTVIPYLVTEYRVDDTSGRTDGYLRDWQVLGDYQAAPGISLFGGARREYVNTFRDQFSSADANLGGWFFGASLNF